MRVNGASEYARMQMLQRQALATRDRLDTAAIEMTTKLKASRFEASGGNLTRLFALERSLDRNAVFTETITLTELRLEITQQGFTQTQQTSELLAMELTSTTSLKDYSAAMIHASSARAAFDSMAGMLNTQVAGQSLFAGAETDSAALIDGGAILAKLDALVAGAATAADVLQIVDDYFADGGEFRTVDYVGSTDPLTAVDIGEGQRLDMGVLAIDERLVAQMRAYATAAVVAGGALAGDTTARLEVLAASGTRMLEAKEGLLDLRAEVGMRQQQVEDAKAARVSERETLDLARTKIVAADPLEAASNYQMLESQLESIFTVTARLASLRFANYMP